MTQHFAQHGHTLTAYIGGSERPHRALTERHGGVWVQAPNQPLGAKWNAIAAKALLDADYLLILGSDDFCSPGLLDCYCTQLGYGVEYVGPEGCYFHDLAECQTVRFPGYGPDHPRHGEPIGAGRLIAAHLITTDPWDADLDCGLDASMTRRLGLPPAVLIPAGPGAYLVDIKTATNIWRYEHVESSSQPDDGEALESLPEWTQLQGVRHGLPSIVAKGVPATRLRIFTHPGILEENRRHGGDMPPIIVRYPDSREDMVHEVRGDGWVLQTKRRGAEVVLETGADVTLITRTPEDQAA